MFYVNKDNLQKLSDAILPRFCYNQFQERFIVLFEGEFDG